MQAWCALWHTVMPGRLIRVVVVRRDAKSNVAKSTDARQRKPVEAFFSTDLSSSTEDVLSEYRERWAIEIDIRDANAFVGLGQDQCRKRQTIIGVNTFRLIMAAARTLWFVGQVERSGGVNLCRYRPWYRQKRSPSQMDVVWACREILLEAGIFPIPRFTPDLTENHAKPEIALPLAA